MENICPYTLICAFTHEIQAKATQGLQHKHNRFINSD